MRKYQQEWYQMFEITIRKCPLKYFVMIDITKFHSSCIQSTLLSNLLISSHFTKKKFGSCNLVKLLFLEVTSKQLSDFSKLFTAKIKIGNITCFMSFLLYLFGSHFITILNIFMLKKLKFLNLLNYFSLWLVAERRFSPFSVFLESVQDPIKLIQYNVTV